MQLKISCSKQSPQIWLSTNPVDFRRSIDGLSEMIISNFNLSLKENIFIFYNQKRDKIKILVWHGNGFILIYKRLEKGCFKVEQKDDSNIVLLDEKQLSWLLAGLDWISMSYWRELEFDDYF